MKYIIINKEHFSFPVLFPAFVSHKQIADEMGGDVRSAGFCHVKNGEAICEGESISLGVESRDGDDLIINTLLLKL